MSIAEPLPLLFQSSPWGSVDAIVQHDGRAVYFILNGPPRFGTRACWVANLVAGPLEFSQGDLAAGQFPVLPRVHQIDQTPMEVPASDDLEVVWFESGDAAALFWSGRLVAVIPPWSGLEGFHGYSANCATQNLVCSPFPSGGKLEARVRQAVAYWQRWRDDPPFRTWQPECLRRYAGRFGQQEQYWSVDGGKFPPRGVAQFRDAEGRLRLVTVGMSLALQPEPRDEQSATGYWPCIELGLEVPADATAPATVSRLVGRLAALLAHPWKNWTWLAPGHTCDLLPDQTGMAKAALVADSPEEAVGLPTNRLPVPVEGWPASRLLWLAPY